MLGMPAIDGFFHRAPTTAGGDPVDLFGEGDGFIERGERQRCPPRPGPRPDGIHKKNLG